MTQISSSPAPTLATHRPDKKYVHGASDGAQLPLATPSERHRPAELMLEGGSPDDQPGEVDRALAKSLAVKPCSNFESRVPAFKTPGERIKWALGQRGMNASQLARHLGISRAAVALWWDKRKPASPHRRFIQVSDLLNVRVEWLVTGRGEALRTNLDTSPGPDDAGTSLDVAGARVVGIAEAEAWREGAATPNGTLVSARYVGEAPLARLRQFAFEVRGTAINQTISPGEYALCVDYRQIRPTGPHQQDLVVVHKRRGNEHKIFVARLHYREHAWELRHESLDPRWQQHGPIRLSPELTRDVGDNGPIEIIGYVFGVFRCNPQPSIDPASPARSTGE